MGARLVRRHTGTRSSVAFGAGNMAPRWMLVHRVVIACDDRELGDMRRILLLLTAISSLALGAGAMATAQEPGSAIAPGTYHGSVGCRGSDRFSNGSPSRGYRSSVRASVDFASRQRVTSWTYVFLLRRDLVKKVRAVRPGESFTYAAGKHIDRPGRTRVTITAVTRTPGRVMIIARLDWASPSTHYIGSGTYALLLERLSRAVIRYEAIKVVVKHPVTRPSRTHPVIRRNELCVGQLMR